MSLDKKTATGGEQLVSEHAQTGCFMWNGVTEEYNSDGTHRIAIPSSTCSSSVNWDDLIDRASRE